MRTDSMITTDPQKKLPANALGYFTNLRNIAVVLSGIGWVGLVLALFGGDLRSFWSSYFFGYIFWLNLTLGCLAITLLHHTIRGSWGLAILRVVEAGNKILPVMALLFIPIAIAMWRHDLYLWANPAEVAKSELLQHKTWWLNPWAWTIRALIYWAFWIGVSRYLNASSLKQDAVGDENLAIARTNVAAPCGVIFVVLLTAAVTDWIMSLDPVWYSTIFGVIFMMSGILAATALGTLIVTGLRNRRPYNEVITERLTRDLGNMLLGFTMFWAYATLSQFLIIWSGNLPEEITFYGNRAQDGLVYVGAFIIAGQFFLPFTALLSGRTKRVPHLLSLVCAWILVLRVVDCFWQITPYFKVGLSSANIGGYLLDFGAFAAIGGVWITLFVANLKKYPLLPSHDLRLVDRAAEGAHH